MTVSNTNSAVAYDPRGVVSAEPVPTAPRLNALDGARLAVLDNTKWNAGKLLRRIAAKLEAENDFAAVTYYRKESFSKNAAPDLIEEIAANSDATLTAIGD